VYRKGDIFMLIKEIIETGIAECTEDTSLKDTYELIQQSSGGFVVVIDSIQHRVPIGIVNEHSICENVVRKSRDTRNLDAGNVMDTNIKRVSENADILECDIIAEDHTVLVVNSKRQFLGTLEPVELERLIAVEQRGARKQSVFSGISARIPAAVEIPAFGWLK